MKAKPIVFKSLAAGLAVLLMVLFLVASSASADKPSNRGNNSPELPPPLQGVSSHQLSTEHWFPWYDNIYMTTWVLVGNPSQAETAAVDIYIAGVKRGSYSIPPGGRVTPQYAGLMDGPVRVVSTNGVKVFTSERVHFASNTDFSEVMGVATEQLSTERWFPWYDNIYMTTWVLVGNPSQTETAAVDIYIAGVKRGSYSIPPGGRVTPQYAGLMDGPVQVVSTNGVKVFTSERVHFANNTSFNEVMGVPPGVAGIACGDCDSRFVNVTGDSMSGSTSSPILDVTNTGTGIGVEGYGGDGGVSGSSGGGYGVFGSSFEGVGVIGRSTWDYGVYADSYGSHALYVNGTSYFTADPTFPNRSIQANEIADGPGSGLDADKLDGYHADQLGATHDHNDRYYTQSELNTSDGNAPNVGSNRVHWDNLVGVPSGFADGVDDTGDGGIACSDCDSRFVNVTGDIMSGSSSDPILVATNSGAGAAIYGYSPNGFAGVDGHSNNGAGVRGIAFETGRAVYGKSWDGIGVYGESDSNYGIYGQSASGTGVYGLASASSGQTYGVYGKSDSTSGVGLYGYASASSGGTQGVVGWSNSTSGVGVWGGTSASSGETWGVYGQSSSTSGRGIAGHASALSGTTYGVRGRSDSHDGYGGYFYSEGDGVYGEASGSYRYGIWGKSVQSIGVYGDTDVSGGYGLATDDYIYTGRGCVGCTSMLIAQNYDDEPLEPGDIVVVSGVTDPISPEAARPVLVVRKADTVSSQGVVGVVEGRYVSKLVTKQVLHLERNEENVPPKAERPAIPVEKESVEEIVVEDAHTTGEPAAPGEYLTVVYRGLAKVKVNASLGAIKVGDLLTSSSNTGHARKAQPMTIQGTKTEVYLAGTIIGKALEPLDSGQALVWVLVDLQ